MYSNYFSVVDDSKSIRLTMSTNTKINATKSANILKHDQRTLDKMRGIH